MRVVILGTGTNVGKTYVTCRLADSLRPHAFVRALKPIESGAPPGEAGDAGAIAAAAGHAAALSPWRFERPVSPHLAAREAGASIALEAVVRWVASEEGQATPDGMTSHVMSREHAAAARITLIETAGGAFSPLSELATNADLARALEPALWLLVAPDALGVLHDCSATVRALGRAPDALVLSAARPADASTGSNAGELRRLRIAEPLCALASGGHDVEPLVRWLLDELPKK